VKQLIRMAACPAMARYDIITMTSAFSKAYPNVDIIIEEVESSYIFSLLQKDIFDIAFCEDIDIDFNCFDTQTVACEKFMLAVPLSNHLAGKDSVCISELRDEHFIMNKFKLHDLSIESCVQAGFRPDIFLMTTRPDVALQYIKEGNDCVYLGLGRTLMFLPSEHHRILKVIDSPLFNFVFAWRKNCQPSDIVMSFLDFADCFVRNC
jgi:DNA-binding transcriptional LysR family regulator